MTFQNIFILVINQIEAQNLFYNKFISCLYIVRRSKFYYTASGITTPIGGLTPIGGRPPIGVMIPEAV